MHSAKAQFDDSFNRIDKVDAIYQHWINTLRLPHTDVEDLLRSEIVYSVSALDRFIHDLVKAGMVEIYEGRRAATPQYSSFNLSIGQHQDIQTAIVPPPGMVFRSIIEKKHSYETFQAHEKIKDALNLIWNETHKWQRIAHAIGRTENDIKTELSNIVIRRNQIVHEMDLDLSTGSAQSISHATTRHIVTFVKLLGETIHSLL